MTFIKFKFTSKKRRGLSSIVGALLFVVLMVSTFAVLGVALTSQTDITSTGRDVAAKDLAKQKEGFTMSASTNVSDELLDFVTNDAKIPVEIFSLVYSGESTEPGYLPTTTVLDIPADASYIMPGETEDVLSTSAPIPLILPGAGEDPIIYTFKTISSLGTIASDTIFCEETGCSDPVVPAGAGALRHSLFMDGPTGINTKTSTFVMFVTNTSNEIVTDIQPAFGVNTAPPVAMPDCTDMWTIIATAPLPDNAITEAIEDCEVDPFPLQTLGPHETMIFKWDFTVRGDIGTVYEFCNFVTGLDGVTPFPPGVTSSPQTCDEIEVIDPNDCDGCGGEGGETIILIDDLLIRPSIFMVIPSPFGATDKGADQKGIWGINVANPTDKSMNITKVTIVGYPPGGQSQDNVFSGASGAQGCLEEDIEPGMGPAIGGYWDCPRDNILVWNGLDDPLILLANSTRSFMVKVEPSGIKPGGELANLDAIIVQANVWSEFGSFGKAGYQSTMYLEKTSIVNVYLSDTTTSRSTILGYENNMAEQVSHNFKAVLADMDEDPTTTVNIGSRLIINIPREWTFDGFNENPIPGFEDPPSVTVHTDGSTQIIAKTDVLVGDGVNDAIGIDFNAISPDIKAPRLYVMYILADGTVTVDGVDKTIGPLNEVVLNVDPDP